MNEWKTSVGQMACGLRHLSSGEEQRGEWLGPHTSCFLGRREVSNFKLPFSAPSCHFFFFYLLCFCKELPPTEVRDVGQLLGHKVPRLHRPHWSCRSGRAEDLPSAPKFFSSGIDAVIPSPSSWHAMPQIAFLLLVGDSFVALC